MSGFKIIAVSGIGNLGLYIVDELLQQKKAGKLDEVRVLTREVRTHWLPLILADPSSQESAHSERNEKLKARGATVAAVNYDEHSSLVAGLKGVDVLIACLPRDALLTQIPLAKAAKDAGVALFVPSEFGDPVTSNAPPDSVPGLKWQVQEACKEAGMPTLIFWTGPFPDYCIIP
jgi:uncharacterized protein YbjT (DUF2867 family)